MAAIGTERLETFGQAALLMLSQAGIVLLAPTLCMGAMFPLAIAAYHDGRANVGQSVGLLYAVNTAGNIVGSVLIGFLAIASFGVRDSILGMMAMNLGVAAAIGVRESASPGLRVAWPLAAIALLVAVDQGVSRQIFFDTFEKPKGSEIIYYREGATDTVAVIDRKQPRARTLVYSDGRGAAGTHTLLWNLYLGHLPMLLHDDPQEVLHVCFGSGNSLMALTRHEPERIDMAELSPHVRETAKYFWTNEDVVNHPSVNLVIEDGRNFVLGTEQSYDVVSLEPPNIFSAGVVNLYTQEFYELVLSRMKPGGIMLQWLPTDQLTESDRGHLIRAFTEAFPAVTIWQQLESPVLLLLGTREPLQVDLEAFRQRFDASCPRAIAT
jgi:spermidine synthase